MEYILKDFAKHLKKNSLEMRRFFSVAGTNCYRIYDRNIRDLPLTVDIYGRFAHITDFRSGDLDNGLSCEVIVDTASRMLYLEKKYVVYKVRNPLKGTEEKKEQHVKLAERGRRTEVTENGLKFLVNLTDYIDTGLFLDHRKTREMVFQASSGMDVLNLFAYTGSFSVYAAAGGARKVDTVDLSANYLRWAKDNFRINDIPFSDGSFYRMDASSFLKEAVRKGKRYDIIVIDPPTFSNSRKMDGTFNIQRDYVSIVKLALELLSVDGFIVFSTNYGKFHFDPGRIPGGAVTDITLSTIDMDFSRKRKPHRCWVIEKGNTGRRKRSGSLRRKRS